MPFQIFECPEHGEFTVKYSFSEEVRETEPCLTFVKDGRKKKRKACMKDSPWRPPRDTTVSVHRYGNELI